MSATIRYRSWMQWTEQCTSCLREGIDSVATIFDIACFQSLFRYKPPGSGTGSRVQFYVYTRQGQPDARFSGWDRQLPRHDGQPREPDTKPDQHRDICDHEPFEQNDDREQRHHRRRGVQAQWIAAAARVDLGKPDVVVHP